MEEQLFQVAYANDDVYSFLVNYFCDQLSDPFFQAGLSEETRYNNNKRWIIARYMVSWLPYEKKYKQILQTIYELAGADME